jgi:hypothetical protein
MLLSSVGFCIAFAVTRVITHVQRGSARTFRSRSRGGFRWLRRRHHHHHLALGILLLLADGYLWLAQLGTGVDRSSPWASRMTSVLYGIGSAVTLDEFALWLNLEDDYWNREGRKSIDAVVLFAALLSLGIWGGPLFRKARSSVKGDHADSEGGLPQQRSTKH